MMTQVNNTYIMINLAQNQEWGRYYKPGKISCQYSHRRQEHWQNSDIKT